MMKKVKGRPSKKVKFDASLTTINANRENIIPAARISFPYKPKKIAEDIHYPVQIHCNNTKTWKALFEVIKDNHSYVVLIFDPSGIIICTHPNDMTDIKKCSIKIFPHQCVKYYVKEQYTINIDTSEFYKIIRTLNDKMEFILFLEQTVKDGTKCNMLTIQSYGENRTQYESYTIEHPDITEELSPKLKLIKNKDSELQYDIIIMMDAAEFHNKCKNMRAISDKFEIRYSSYKGKKSLVFTFLTNNKIKHESILHESNTCIFNRVPNKDLILSNTFEFDKIYKFTKCFKISTMLKFGFSLDPSIPSCFEYDINTLAGTIQFFIEKTKE